MKKTDLTEIKKEWEDFLNRNAIDDEINVHDAWEFWVYRFSYHLKQSYQSGFQDALDKVEKEIKEFGKSNALGDEDGIYWLNQKEISKILHSLKQPKEKC